jgi:hypothetical protein
MDFENTSGDITNVYGAGSPESKDTNKFADFEGIAIHCALNNALCTPPPAGGLRGPGQFGAADLLPQEPNGYVGFNGIFGHKYVVPALTGGSTLNDLNGNPINGFPGFGSISPAQTLAYVATMLENGVPIVFSYISDAHDCHNCPQSMAFGPGESAYVSQLQAYDAGFNLFFQRLANEGIDANNTLFVVASDEQDHFVGGPAAPANCDGVNVACTYTYADGSRSVGEIQADLQGLYNQQFPSLVPDLNNASNIFDFHFDMAPTFTFKGFGPLDNGDVTALRPFERAAAQLTATSPITGNTDNLSLYLVDRVGMKALHMITGDPFRTPNFVMFGNPNYYFQGNNCSNSGNPRTSCIVVQAPGFAWNHGGVAPEINTTWVGLAGPGVRHNGIDNFTWADETDVRPTILALAGLQDDYVSDGRVLVEGLNSSAVPPAMNSPLFRALAATYKQLNAPLGVFGQGTLRVSTVALTSGSSAADSKYQALESKLTTLTTQRDSVAESIRTVLDGVEFHGQTLDPLRAIRLLLQAGGVLVEMGFLAGSAH